MRVFVNLFLIFGVTIFLSSCSTLPTTFTTENIMKVHQGMNSDEVRDLFGDPMNVNIDVCGRPPNQWTCTTWKYGDSGYDSASFTFSGKHNALKLNSFNVDGETWGDL